MEVYDAWDLEQAMNYQQIKRTGNKWFFVRNVDYDSYDTSQMITKDAAENFISNDLILQRRGLDGMSNPDAIVNISRKERRKRKKG